MNAVASLLIGNADLIGELNLGRGTLVLSHFSTFADICESAKARGQTERSHWLTHLRRLRNSANGK
jgi:hypothetical protein